ncbi:heterokaryon incompatibility protein-domain-containing protein, partial [Microdochium bolleyi]
MRLLQRLDHSFVLREYSNDVPPYGILSHMWGDDEIDYQDIQNNTAHAKKGFNKLMFCWRQAHEDGLAHFWVDTCCIDRTSSSELSEAINSMFRWYQNAAQCYVYLSDVSLKGSTEGGGAVSQASALAASRWFTRTWTLVELIAPAHVKFYDHQCQLIGDKDSLQTTIQSKTGIPAKVLSKTKSLSTYSVEQRLDWAKGRRATRPEDESYALLGLFDIQIPIIYGEGSDYARRRLRTAI